MCAKIVPYDQKTLRSVQLAELEILREVDRVCQILGVSYVLAYGTALGAKRHQGFIPWDDDIDIGMLANDYEQFLQKAPDLLDEKFTLEYYPLLTDYPFYFAKVFVKDSLYVEEYTKHLDISHGIWLDIFCFDNFPDDPDVAQIYVSKARRMYHYFTACSLKKTYDTRGGAKVRAKNLVRRTLHGVMKFRDKRRVYERLKFWMELYNDEETEYVWTDFSPRWKVPRKMFEETKPVLFEGFYFPAPQALDEYLKLTYDTWEDLPPEEDQIGHMPVKLELPGEDFQEDSTKEENL